MKKIIQLIKGFFVKPDVTSSLWEYGTCYALRHHQLSEPSKARRHKIKKNVQFVLWKAGEQGHIEDCWYDYHISHWGNFTPTN